MLAANVGLLHIHILQTNRVKQFKQKQESVPKSS